MNNVKLGLKEELIFKVKNEIEVLRKQLEEANELYSLLSGNNSIKEVDNRVASISPKITWYKRITEALTHLNRIALSKEIIDHLIKNDSAIDRSIAIKSVTATISQKIGKGLERIERDGDFYTGLEEWFNEDKTLISKYNLKQKEQIQDSLFKGIPLN